MSLFPGIKKQIFLCLFFLFSLFTNLYSQTLIINEVSNGPSGNKEYIELVVVDNAVVYNCTNTTPPCIDIRGWIIDDNSGYHSGGGVAAGANRFSQDPIWACVPLGTIILIYNDADINASIPAQDLSLSDGNCKIIAPISNTSFFETNITTPGALACSYPPSGWIPGGNWASTLLANTGDCARIVDLNGCEVFSLCWASCNANNLIYFLSGSSGTDNVWYFNDGDPNLQSNWGEGCTDPTSCGINEQTPGAPNNLLNQNFIGQFNNNCSIITPIIVIATSVDAGCVCNGTAEANASGSIPGYDYEWFDNGYVNSIGTGFSISGLCAGTYHVVATSLIGCADSATVIISNNGINPTATPTTISPICEGESIFLFGNSIIGATYQWTGPNGFSSSQQNPEILNATIADEGNYTLVIQTGTCNSLPVDVFVEINPLPIAVPISNSPVCFGDTVFLFGNVISGATYQWTGPNGFSSSQQNPEIINAAIADEGNYTLVIQSGTCISSPVDVLVDINPLPIINVSSNSPICIGDTILLFANSIGANLFSWSGPNSYSANGNNQEILNAGILANGMYTVIVELNGCVDSAQVNVSVINPTVATINNVNSVCENQSVFNLVGTPSGGIWSGTGITNSTTGTFNPSTSGAGNHQITYSFNSSCITDATIIIIVNPLPTANAGVDQSFFCDFSPMNLNAANSTGNSITYEWEINSGNISNGIQTPTPTISTPGIYILTVTDVNGCSDSDTVIINFTSGPNASFIANPSTGTVPLEVDVINQSTGVGLTYEWMTCENESSILFEPQFNFDSSGYCMIQLLVTDLNGCIDSSIQMITLYDPHSIYVPNIFTPNGDANNNLFQVSGDGIDKFKLAIYNRWGQLLFSSDAIQNSWDGNFENKPVPDGTYYFILNVSYSNTEFEIIKGNLTLIRN
jgi:gliding motility-associated-like protein